MAVEPVIIGGATLYCDDCEAVIPTLPAVDGERIMRDFYPNSGWGLAEKSALDMGGKA